MQSQQESSGRNKAAAASTLFQHSMHSLVVHNGAQVVKKERKNHNMRSEMEKRRRGKCI